MPLLTSNASYLIAAYYIYQSNSSLKKVKKLEFLWLKIVSHLIVYVNLEQMCDETIKPYYCSYC